MLSSPQHSVKTLVTTKVSIGSGVSIGKLCLHHQTVSKEQGNFNLFTLWLLVVCVVGQHQVLLRSIRRFGIEVQNIAALFS